MYNLLNIYDCPKCGKILSDQVTHGETIDFDRDDVYEVTLCNKCDCEATIRTSKNEQTGQLMYHYEEVDDERANWANGFYDEEDNNDIDYFDGDK